jgi:pimeloyl-ACP methyl ester carboxylesterase
MIDINNGYVKVGGGQVYYEVSGTGETLVLVHAGFVDSGMWDSQWDAFRDHFQVIRYDMRGYGKSDAMQAPLERREELHQVLTHLGVRKAHLLGCSMGGTTVIDFVLDHPEMVSSLIAVSATPSGFEMKGEPPPEMIEMMEAAQQGDVTRTSELQIRIWVDGMYRNPLDVDAGVRKQASAMNLIPVKNNTWAMSSQPVEPLDPPALKRLKEISVPTLIIDGAVDHPEILRAGDTMQKAIKGAKKVVIQDAAHVPNMEKPDEFNQAVLEFLGA